MNNRKKPFKVSSDGDTYSSQCAVLTPSVERGCTGKINLGKTDYEEAADRMGRKHGKQYGVYHCPHCDGTHLTTKIGLAELYSEPLLYVSKPYIREDI